MPVRLPGQRHGSVRETRPKRIGPRLSGCLPRLAAAGSPPVSSRCSRHWPSGWTSRSGTAARSARTRMTSARRGTPSSVARPRRRSVDSRRPGPLPHPARSACAARRSVHLLGKPRTAPRTPEVLRRTVAAVPIGYHPAGLWRCSRCAWPVASGSTAMYCNPSHLTRGHGRGCSRAGPASRRATTGIARRGTGAPGNALPESVRTADRLQTSTLAAVAGDPAQSVPQAESFTGSASAAIQRRTQRPALSPARRARRTRSASKHLP